MKFRPVVRRALREDRAHWDITSKLFLPPGARAEGRVVANARGVVSGARAAAEAFLLRDKRCRVRVHITDGRPIRRGDVVLTVRGPLSSILSAERSALNLLTHLSGIATLTHAFVRKAGKRARILDTRKTRPGLRDLEKWAVVCGGGVNHRRDLSDAVLIKENHLDAWGRSFHPERFMIGIRKARDRGLTVIMEARNHREVLLALGVGADIILLDNFPVKGLPKTIRWIGAFCRKHAIRKPLLEVSGGVTLATVGRIARAGVDRISIGGLTHSALALDMSLDIRTLRRG